MAASWLRILPARLRDRVESSPTLRRLVPNTGWLVADRLGRMAVSLVVSAWVARYLGPDSFGRYNFALAWVAIFTAFTTFGLERIAVRELVKSPEQARTILGSAFTLRLAGGVICFAGATASLALLRPGDAEMLSMVAILSGVYVLQAFDVIDYWNQARVRARATVMAMSVGFLMASIARVVLIVMKAPVIAFTWPWWAEIGAGSLGLAIGYQLREGSLLDWRVARDRITQLLRDGFPLMLSGLMVMIYSRIDQVMLGQMATAHELGIYAAAVKLVEAWYFLPSAIAASAFPSVVAARQISEEVFEYRMQKLYDLMARLSYVICIPVSLGAVLWTRLIFGDAYAASAPMLALLIWSLVFTSLGAARGLFLSAMNWNWAYLMTVTVGCVVNVVLNLVLIPRIGGMGAVIASCVGYWAATHGSCYLYPPLFRTAGMLTKSLIPWRRERPVTP